MNRYAIYFLLAFIPTFFGVATPPSSRWDWAKLIGMAIYQGLVAVKALQSQSPSNDPPKPKEEPTTTEQK